jgi:hypothetical protein
MSRIWRFIQKHDPVIGQRSKHRVAILLITVNLAAGLMAFVDPWRSLEFSWLLWPGAMIAVLAAAYYDAHLRCPDCSKAVWYNPIGFGSKRVWSWTPWVPGVCTRCGNPVDQEGSK